MWCSQFTHLVTDFMKWYPKDWYKIKTKEIVKNGKTETFPFLLFWGLNNLSRYTLKVKSAIKSVI